VRAASGFLAGGFPRPYNTGNFAALKGKGEAMETFDDFGKALEAELEHLRRFLSDEVVPHTRRAAIEALRTASSRLEDLAVDLEARVKSPDKSPDKQDHSQPGKKADANPR
jgi:hypothetical protein